MTFRTRSRTMCIVSAERRALEHSATRRVSPHRKNARNCMPLNATLGDACRGRRTRPARQRAWRRRLMPRRSAMGKEPVTPRFGPEHWVTLRATGEHVKIEAWSAIAAAYRVRSRKRGVLFAVDDELDEILVHPEVGLGKHWARCAAPGCGAPLTPELAVCGRCHAPTCACGRCRCARTPPAGTGKKTPRKRIAPKAR